MKHYKTVTLVLTALALAGCAQKKIRFVNAPLAHLPDAEYNQKYTVAMSECRMESYKAVPPSATSYRQVQGNSPGDSFAQNFQASYEATQNEQLRQDLLFGCMAGKGWIAEVREN